MVKNLRNKQKFVKDHTFHVNKYFFMIIDNLESGVNQQQQQKRANPFLLFLCDNCDSVIKQCMLF